MISIDQMNWTWCLLNIPRVDIVSVACMTGRNYDRDIIMNYATSCQFEDYQVWTFYSLVSMLAFIHFLWHPLKTCIESHHEMNDVLWHDIDKYLIKMCYMVMFVLTTKLWNLGNIGKNIISFLKWTVIYLIHSVKYRTVWSLRFVASICTWSVSFY